MPNVIAQITTQLPQPSLPQAVQTAGDTLRSLVEANAYVEQRSLLTNITESFASTNTGPVVGVSRIFDAYGELGQETIIGGNSYSANQGWDAAGRRTGLSVANFGFGFGFRADGLMTSVSGQGGSGSYAYDTGGLIQSRSFSPRVTTINARDGAGRPTSITTTVNGVSTLTENLSFTPDGLLATHSIGRPDFTDNRAYTYASQSRRLTQEITGITSGTNWTNGYVYDNGAAAGPGVMTSSGQTVGTNVEWNGGTDAFSRIGMATNSVAQRQAYGFLNGPATMTALLDGNPTPVTTVGTNDNYEWWAQLQLAPGPHQLVVNALNWSGYYTASATNTFTNNAADHVVNAYAGNGEITNRVWISSNGQTNATEKLSFDARDRLHSVTRLDSNSNGYSWNAAYDGYGRRLSTTTTYITNGVILTNMVKSIGQFYDPQVQFLELGEYDSGVTTWKFYGPDANGVYGGMQGAGGLEAVVNGPRTASAVVNDARGNALALYNVSESSLVWFPSRPTSYGAVPGYAPLPLTDGAKIAQSSAWHHKWPDATGYYSLGNRILDPISHTWLSADPLGHDSDPSLFTFCGGDPVNAFDPDGRCVEGTIAGWNSAPVPANASSAFMAGYYGGGVTSGFAEGWNGGSQIVDNTLTFGATDALGLTDTSQLQGSEYTDSLILANVARSSLLTAATFGTAALAQGGSQAALYGYQGLQIYNAGSSGYSIGTGINQVANGNNWGYLNIAGGTLGVVGSTTFAAGNPTLNSLAGVGPSSGGFAQSAVTWWNTGSEGDAAFQNLSFGQQLQSEIGQNAVSGTSTSGTYAQIGGDSATALQKGANILQSGNPMNIFGLNLPQTFNLLGTGPTAGVRLYVPPAAFIGAGAINAVNTATSP